MIYNGTLDDIYICAHMHTRHVRTYVHMYECIDSHVILVNPPNKCGACLFALIGLDTLDAININDC